MALKRLDNDEVTKFNLGGLRGEVNIINESGLYSLVMRSRKPDAHAFRRWVTGEVLPTIRQTGAYMTKDTADNILNDPQTAVTLAHEILTDPDTTGGGTVAYREPPSRETGVPAHILSRTRTF